MAERQSISSLDDLIIVDDEDEDSLDSFNNDGCVRIKKDGTMTFLFDTELVMRSRLSFCFRL